MRVVVEMSADETLRLAEGHADYPMVERLMQARQEAIRLDAIGYRMSVKVEDDRGREVEPAAYAKRAK